MFGDLVSKNINQIGKKINSEILC